MTLAKADRGAQAVIKGRLIETETDCGPRAGRARGVHNPDRLLQP